MTRSTFLLTCGFLTLLGGVALAACQTDNTEAIIVNDLPADAAQPFTVYRVWYRSTLYLEPVAPGTQSEALRVGAGTEPAYALLVPGFQPEDPDAGPPTLPLIAARTRLPIPTEPGETSRLVFSRTSALIGCDGPDALTKDEHDFIRTRIFPGEQIAGCGAAPVQP